MHLAFCDPAGDCHVKAAAVAGEEVGVAETVGADLTGVAIQDFEIARSVWKRLPPA